MSKNDRTEETIKELWDHLRKGHEQDRFLAFDPDNDYIINKIHEHAENDTIFPQARTQQPRPRRNHDRTTNINNPTTPAQNQPFNQPNTPTIWARGENLRTVPTNTPTGVDAKINSDS